MPNPLTSQPSQLAAVRKGSKSSAATSAVTHPPLPRTLRPELQGEWERLIDHQIALGFWAEPKAPLIEQYLMNLTIVRDAQAQLAEDGLLIDGKAHPASAIIARHSITAAKLASMLHLAKELKVSAKAESKTSEWDV